MTDSWYVIATLLHTGAATESARVAWPYVVCPALAGPVEAVVGHSGILCLLCRAGGKFRNNFCPPYLKLLPRYWHDARGKERERESCV